MKKSLAIAYSMKKKAERKKYDDGGKVKPTPTPEEHSPNEGIVQKVKDAWNGIDPYTGKPKKAHGGFISEEEASGFASHEGNTQRPNHAAMMEEEKKLNQHHVMAMNSMKEALVDRIMNQSSKDFSSLDRYSQGGKVANQEHGKDNNELAGFLPNEFDDLVIRDDLESSYDGANAGDHLGNSQEDEDRRDIVSQIMKSRAKKDRLPNPR